MTEKPSESIVIPTSPATKKITLLYVNGQWKADYDPTSDLLTRRDVTVLLPRVLSVLQRTELRQFRIKEIQNNRANTITSSAVISTERKV